MNKLNILYEDNHLMVVIKPVNILSQSDVTGDMDMLTMIKDYIKEKYHKPGNVYVGLVQRLDRVVGGVMVFAKTSKAASRLSEQIRLKEMDKKYLAIVHGSLKEKDTYIDYLEKKDDFKTIVTDQKHGQYAELSYQLREYNQQNDLSLVEVSLKTGRHHQIRVQFSSRNHPLYGDNRYGNDGGKEIGLFAYRLSLIHPTLRKEMTFTYYPNNSKFGCFECLKKKLF